MLKSAFLFAAIGMLIGCSGCLKQTLWRDANERKMRFDSLAGVARWNGASTKELVCAYRREHGTLAYLSIPLTDEGHPKPPFEYTVRDHIFQTDFGASITSQQIDAVIGAAGKLERRDLSLANRFAIDDKRPEMYDSYGSNAGPLLAIAYRALPDGRLQRINFTHVSDGSSQQVANDAIIVLVPNECDRPADEVFAARTKAIVLTPVSVVIDAVTITVASPFFLVLFFTHGPAI